VDVAALIRRGAASRAPDPLAAVMGEDWAELDLGKGSAAQLLRLNYLLRQQMGREHARAVPSGLEAVSGGQAAMVKLIGKGGARDRAGLGRQMAYLGRGGEVPLQRSERYFGTEIEAEDFEAFAAGWGMTDRSRAAPDGADRTSHFLVSFPPGTDPGAAERAGRAWAEAMFATGRFGDVWDYYTAFHTDRAHPHLHVVVNRRGLENGAWLKVSKRSAITWDVLREVQVEVAAEEGIALDSSPRLARGLHDRPAPDAEVRRASREGRAVEALGHTPESAVVAAATVLTFARRYEADAALARARRPELAAALDALAQTIKAGRAHEAGGQGEIFGREEIKAMAETLTEQRRAVLSRIAAMDREVAGLTEPAERARFERSHAAIKAEASRYIPDRPDLAGFAEPDEAGRYRGLRVSDDPRAREIATDAGRRVAALAREAGLDGAAAAARHASDAAAPKRLADAWEREERAAIAAALSRKGRATGPDDPEVAGALRALRAQIAAVHAGAAAEIETATAERAQLGRIVERGGPVTPEGFAKAERDVARLLSAEEKQAILERGPEGAQALTPSAAGARVLARLHLAGVARDETAEDALRARARATLAALDAEAARRDAGQRSRDGLEQGDAGRNGADAPASRGRARRRDDDGHGL
jgi:type IV secretion system T-DNA border endonuclease VirD2